MIGLGGPTAVGGGAAVETAFVALIGERNTQVVYFPTEGIKKSRKHGVRSGCGW